MPTPSDRARALGELGPAVAGLLVSTAIVKAADLHAEVVAFLCQDNDHLVVCTLSALRAACKARRQTHPESGLHAIARPLRRPARGSAGPTDPGRR